MQSIVQDIINRTPDVVRQMQGMVPRGFPIQIADSILDGLKACTERLGADLSS
jgi:serine/threonine-protein kinase HipA